MTIATASRPECTSTPCTEGIAQGKRPLISIVTPCYNEEENVVELYHQVAAQMAKCPDFDYEHIFHRQCLD
jgi:hypothetical protein